MTRGSQWREISASFDAEWIASEPRSGVRGVGTSAIGGWKGRVVEAPGFEPGESAPEQG
jgi:hypothetical protein